MHQIQVQRHIHRQIGIRPELPGDNHQRFAIKQPVEAQQVAFFRSAGPVQRQTARPASSADCAEGISLPTGPGSGVVLGV